VLEVPLEIAHECPHVEKRIVGEEPGGRGLDGHLVDVDGHVTDGLTEPVPGLEEPARLGRRSRPQLHDVLRGEGVHEAGSDLLEKGGLGTGEIVLGQLRDVLEELGPRRVVEIFRGQAHRR
jgi:hypothetical protein